MADQQSNTTQTPAGRADNDSGRPGGGVGRKDVTGIAPDNIRVDPDITEGHPGYQESGDSEISPPRGPEKATSG